MSHIEFTHVLRQLELERALEDFPHTPPESVRILEIGAGTGFQAKILSDLGFAVTALDVAQSAYRNERVYPVIEYNGCKIPAADQSFDVVFSSNVLEHVRDIGAFLQEARRVMTAGGTAVHVLPTPSWRFWTMLTHYVWLLKRISARSFALLENKTGGNGIKALSIHSIPKAILATIFPLRHGERGMTVTELYYYSRGWWIRQFEANGYRIARTYPADLFYTGSFALGSALPINARRWLSRIFGSACRVYVMSRSNEL